MNDHNTGKNILRFFIVLAGSSFLILNACNNKEQADTIIYSKDIQTVDSIMSSVQAIAIKDGLVLATGDTEEIKSYQGSETQILNFEDAFVMPGFIEGHGHFSGLGSSLANLNFLKSQSWQEITAMVEEKVESSKPGEWIYGRGWHQDKWTQSPDDAVGFYPTHQTLSEISPDNPVILFHASGHSLFANDQAMKKAGITAEMPDPKGGHIVRDGNGDAIGVFEERAMTPIKDAYKEYLDGLSQEKLAEEWHEGIRLASNECIQKGITSFQDAGSKMYELERYSQLAKDGALGIRLWAMIRHSSEEMEGKLQQYKEVDTGNGFFTCNAIKSEVDGALGSYGAWLLAPYDDKPGFVGQNTTDIEEVAAIAKQAKANDMQLCVHAIGDKANNVVLDIIEENTDPSDDHRWRIEHAQHLDPDDIIRFKSTGAIASMQGVHCTSDAPFVATRLGQIRAKMGAYVWKSLIESGAMVINGTDAPVEDVNPIKSFYASVTRKREDNGFEFFTEQKMTREEAVRSYTINCAFAAFEEDQKGSLEAGKYADLIVLSNNLLECADDEILTTKVLMTMIDGKVVYPNE